MIIFDGIIENIQENGGISVLFRELISRIDSCVYYSYAPFSSIATQVSQNILIKPRLFERYLDAEIPALSTNNQIFHSTYYRLPKYRKTKIVTTVHDFTYEKFVSGPAKWVHCWQKYRAIRNSDIVICVSNNTAKDLARYCPVDPKKIRVVHNGVSESYHPLYPSLAINDEILFLGARSGYKNFDLAIMTLARLPKFRLSIVGGGILNSLEIEMLNQYIPGRYKWLGTLTDEELNTVYNRAYALLYPSSYEGFGIPVIEAMRAGCPVVATEVSSIPEVAGDAAILTKMADANLFADALMRVESNRNKMKSAGYEQAKKFSWDKCFKETLQVYKELL